MAACLLFDDWEAARPLEEHTATTTPVADYVPGEFFRRELPCVMNVLRPHLERIAAVIVDSFVWLPLSVEETTRQDRVLREWREAKTATPLPHNCRPGMGAWLYLELGGDIPVVGVAKTGFHGIIEASEVLRGDSSKPLFVTAAGMDAAEAADCVRRMDGEHRLPTLLRRVDRLARTASGGDR